MLKGTLSLPDSLSFYVSRFKSNLPEDPFTENVDNLGDVLEGPGLEPVDHKLLPLEVGLHGEPSDLAEGLTSGGIFYDYEAYHLFICHFQELVIDFLLPSPCITIIEIL